MTDVRVLEKYGFHDSNEEMSLAIRKKRIEYEDWNSFLRRMFGEKKNPFPAAFSNVVFRGNGSFKRKIGINTDY